MHVSAAKVNILSFRTYLTVPISPGISINVWVAAAQAVTAALTLVALANLLKPFIFLSINLPLSTCIDESECGIYSILCAPVDGVILCSYFSCIY